MLKLQIVKTEKVEKPSLTERVNHTLVRRAMKKQLLNSQVDALLLAASTSDSTTE